MGKIGVLGNITFEVSDGKMLTWQEWTRDTAGRWATHDIYGGKPVIEFLGPGLSSIEISVRLDAQFKIVPLDEIKKMREAMNTGAVLQFTLGSNRTAELIGDFALKNVSEQWTHFSREGDLLCAIVRLSLLEYAQTRAQSLDPAFEKARLQRAFNKFAI